MMEGRGALHYQTSHGEASSCKSRQTQLFPRVQSQVSFGQTPEALRGLIEMSLNLNVLWGTPIDNFLGQVFSGPCKYAPGGALEAQVFTVDTWFGLTFPELGEPQPTLAHQCTSMSALRSAAAWQLSLAAIPLGTTCLEVPEKPDLTFPLAKSSRLGPKSLSHITREHLIRASCQAPMWIGRNTEPVLGRRCKIPRLEEAHEVIWERSQLVYQNLPPFMVWTSFCPPKFRIILETFLQLTLNLQNVNSSGSHLFSLHIKNHYIHTAKILLDSSYPESLSGTLS